MTGWGTPCKLPNVFICQNNYPVQEQSHIPPNGEWKLIRGYVTSQEGVIKVSNVPIHYKPNWVTFC